MSNSSLSMKLLDYINGDQDPFESGIVTWTPGIGAVIGLLKGLSLGFVKAGIGGAIVYGLGGIFAGAVVGLLIGLLIAGFLRSFWIIVYVLLALGIVWGIRALWGVGKP